MNSAIVPESLLAFSKDSRYIAELQSILAKLLSTFARNEDFVKHDAWFLGTIIYILLVVGKKGKTLGMEALGLDLEKPQQRSNLYLVVSSVSVAGILYVIRRALRDTSTVNETTTGRRRREIYDAQRRAMLERTQRDTPGGILSPLNNATNQSLQEQSWSQKASRMLRDVLDTLMSTESHGPHDVAGTERRTMIGHWLLRLHLAYFCLGGSYPTLYHRLFGLKMKEMERSSLINRPAIVRITGMLILAHAAGVCVQEVIRAVVRKYVNTLAKQQRQPNFALDTSAPNTEQVNPGICTICHQERKHPACPVSCGHVVCWNCLQQWVQLVRPECPICRSPCQPQDVLALYNYAPASAMTQ